MPRISLHSALVIFLAMGLIPPAAAAFAEAGAQLERVELPAIGGGKQPFLSSTAKVNAFVFFRADQERSLDALRQMAACEKALAGKSVHWVAVVSDSASPAEVKAMAAGAGIRMPVLVDQGDKLYEKLQIRLHPVVGLADGKGVLKALEAYRQLDYGDVIQTQIRFLLGEVDQAAVDHAVAPDASPLPGADPVKKAMRDVNMARTLIEIGQYEQAVKQAQRAMEQAPVPAVFGVLGTAYARLGRCAEAKRMLDQAQKFEPASAAIPAARALCKGK